MADVHAMALKHSRHSKTELSPFGLPLGPDPRGARQAMAPAPLSEAERAMEKTKQEIAKVNQQKMARSLNASLLERYKAIQGVEGPGALPSYARPVRGRDSCMPRSSSSQPDLALSRSSTCCGTTHSVCGLLQPSTEPAQGKRKTVCRQRRYSCQGSNSGF
eukprot:464088-Prymnesium_polylepis.1